MKPLDPCVVPLSSITCPAWEAGPLRGVEFIRVAQPQISRPGEILFSWDNGNSRNGDTSEGFPGNCFQNYFFYKKIFPMPFSPYSQLFPSLMLSYLFYKYYLFHNNNKKLCNNIKKAHKI